MSSMFTGSRTAPALVAGALLMFAGFSFNAAAANEPAELTGTYFIAGENVADPPADEAQTHVYLTIEGQAAIEIYDALTEPETEDVCQPERMMKLMDGLYCSIAADRSEATCDFAIDLLEVRLTAGRPC